MAAPISGYQESLLPDRLELDSGYSGKLETGAESSHSGNRGFEVAVQGGGM